MSATEKSVKQRDTFPVRAVDSILDELKMMREAVMDRAYDIFDRRGRAAGRAIEDWLAAERELAWKPAIELTECDGMLTLQAAVAGLEAEELDVQATPEEILIKSERTHSDENAGKVHRCEFRRGKLFREVQLPSRIDPERAEAEYYNGLLRISAPIVAGRETHRVEVSGGS